ncbi:hypothetical protein HNP38_001943 [Chryseobacterium defluvii]|uniref:Tetratricopeptide repeat protein n=1 Tax=Chryseobacterium defluvii TaxID=160396 RepID=A0A840KF93_9FLAO|nr:hypothetical protein [Chryseobacterium defluvii]MBB4806647.1 hypothetical protein [Chryseobacterium defluvii]
MKKFLLIGFCVAGFWARAQVTTEKTLQQSVLQLNTAKTANDYDVLFKKFSENDISEKWKAHYYAAVALYLKTDLALKKGINPALAEPNALAGKYALSALSAQRSNGEIQTLLGLIYLQRVLLNASPNKQKDLSTISEYISKAENSLPDNPRLIYLKAEMASKFPANSITGKSDAGQLYQKALTGFDSYSSSDSFAPGWGKQLLQNR